jgi:tetratricopeptide (TPR) repeat protein
MTAEHTNSPDGKERFSAVLLACLEAMDNGQPVRREELLARHSEFAADLGKFLEDQERVDRCAAPLRAVARAAQLAALPTPSPHLTVSETGEEVPPDSDNSFGHYELLGELGRGGMGVVYKARQKGLGRLVALKVVGPAGGAGGPEQQRFRKEAEMVAELDHPHIVPVYEVGEHAGQLYLSMKLFEGGSLAEHLGHFASDQRGAARLLAQVARAVHHAHQRGILHRDLKPANILLDAAGQPHVSDFGLARRVEGDSGLTQSGAIIGTPGYMAPEQAEGRRGPVTTAADVYGLGAVLYALLTGKPPFRGDSVLETLEQVRNREPDPPSRSNPKMDRDLETICLKCLEKDPARRYGSAEALADDLERWLKGEPIKARALTWTSRFGRWCRRNPVVSALAATIGVLLLLGVAGLAMGTWLLWREQEQTQKALTEARANHTRAEAQRQRAEVNFRKAYHMVEQLLCAFQPDQNSRPLSVAELRQWQTERALAFLAPFCEDPSEEPAVRLQKGVAYVHTGRVYQVLGDREKAQKAFHQAVAVFERLVRDFSDNPLYPRELAVALHILAEDLYQAGRLADANGCFRQAVSVWRGAVRDHPADHVACIELANALCFWFDRDLRAPEAALEAAHKAVKLAPELPAPWTALGVASYRSGQWEDAVRALQEAFRRAEGKMDWGPLHASFFLAMAQWRCGRQDEAMRAYRQALRRMNERPLHRDVLDRAIHVEATAVLGAKELPTLKAKEESPRKH